MIAVKRPVTLNETPLSVPDRIQFKRSLQNLLDIIAKLEADIKELRPYKELANNRKKLLEQKNQEIYRLRYRIKNGKLPEVEPTPENANEYAQTDMGSKTG